MSSRRRVLAGVVLALALVATACGGDDDDTTAASATTAAPSTTAGDTATTKNGPAGGGTDDPWRRTAAEHRGKNGNRFTIDCPPRGTEAPIWGVETYTDDSSICTAAVHVGLITFDEGGEVEYEIVAGRDAYDAARGNGVLSSRYAAYEGSFVFPEAPPGSGEFTVGPESWRRTATEFPQEAGEQHVVDCAPGGPIASIWGTGVYTADSSICTAAVHAGLITVADGGTVAFELADGRDDYDGTSANGVTSSDYGRYDRSFTFPEDQPDD